MSHAAEVLRQRSLVRALWRDDAVARLRAHVAGQEAGLAAYRGNAAAVAERALSSAFPTVAALVGAESFAALAQGLWQQHPPTCGDLAQWGAELPAWLATLPGLASEPFLADSAALDWHVHRAAHAADAGLHAASFAQLAHVDPTELVLVLAPGAALVESVWPVASIWLAHQRPADDEHRFDGVRDALAQTRGESAFVWREGFTVCVAAIEAPQAAFTRTLMARGNLAQALDAAGDDFAFDIWLARALSAGWLDRVTRVDSPIDTLAPP